MYRATAMCVVSLLAPLRVAGQIENVIYQHNANLDPGQHYVIQQDLQRVTILLGMQGETFEFEARLEENGQDVGPGDINLIEALANAGPVTITIVGHHGHRRGARDVKEINLGADGVTSTIAGIEISDDLGDLGNIVADSISGPISIGDDARHDIDIAGDITGPITIGDHLHANIWCRSLGDLTAMGTGTHTGFIDVGTGYAGSMFLNGSISGWIWIHGPLRGLIESSGDLNVVWIYGSVTQSGRIVAGNDAFQVVVDLYGDVRGQIQIGNDVGFNVYVSGNLYGDVDVGNDVPYGAGVLVCHSLEASGRILVGGDVGGVIGITLDLGVGGAVTVGGNLTGAFSATTDMTCHLRVAQLTGDIHVGSPLAPHDLTGTVTIDGDADGSIDVSGHVLGDIAIGGSLGANANISVGSDFDGTLEIAGDMRGQLRVDGSVLSEVLPAIHVHGSVYGNANNEPVISVGSDLGSPIAIDGSLRNKPPGGSGSPGPEILVEGSFGDYGATAVDYDGWQSEDVWKPAAKVQVGQVTYSENTPAAHVWEIQKCKGDMNNDGWVDANDVEPFDLALNNPSQYEAEFPGLAGSMLYHGDCDCDGDLDNDDRGALLALVGAGCCTTDCVIYWCEEYPMESGVLPVVEMLENAVSPRLRPAMVATVSAIADYLGQTDLGRFWSEALGHLREGP